MTARDPESGEEFVIFDGGRHGYDNMFCDEHDPSELEHRPLKRYEIPASKLVLELGYSIDYEDEKENFEPDEAGSQELQNIWVYAFWTEPSVHLIHQLWEMPNPYIQIPLTMPRWKTMRNF
ncbi:Uncharacterised protein [uncultured Clostridium sp.]|nr:Uncharacterised protein [uncultured Clostridium sp.]